MKGLHLDHDLHFSIGTLASQINGCDFCMDLGRSMAIREHMGMEKFNALSEYRTSPLFSERQLRWPWRTSRKPLATSGFRNATFEELRKHFSEQEIVEITWVKPRWKTIIISSICRWGSNRTALWPLPEMQSA